MLDKQQIKEHMEVTDASGQQVGKVDSIEGEQIKLTRSDSPDGRHHFLSFDDLDRIDGDTIYLKQGAQVPQGA
jgi:hypothetical protein